MSYLVTGVAGFIGSHLAGALLDEGKTVIGIDCFTEYYPKSKKLANLEKINQREGKIDNTVIRDFILTEGYTFEAGVLPLADGRGAILDEFDKPIQADMKHLNDALDECRFTVHKASIHMDLWARCWMTAMLNPVDGRINSYEPLYKQVGIPPDTLSRFDLVFVMPDIREEAKDSHVGYAMLNARGIPHSGSNGNSPGTERTLMPLEDMQKLIAYAKTINPVLSKEAGDEIHRQWMGEGNRAARIRLLLPQGLWEH